MHVLRHTERVIYQETE